MLSCFKLESRRFEPRDHGNCWEEMHKQSFNVCRKLSESALALRDSCPANPYEWSTLLKCPRFSSELLQGFCNGAELDFYLTQWVISAVEEQQTLFWRPFTDSYRGRWHMLSPLYDPAETLNSNVHRSFGKRHCARVTMFSTATLEIMLEVWD